jgi:single-strand DNA-binding protein
MNETYVTIKGRLTADPNVRTTRAGAPMTKIRIAQSARRQVPGQPGQWEDTEPSFYDVVTYRSLAANIAVSLRRGQPVTVHGKQRIVSWQREDGSTWYGVEIEADAVGHDLTFGTTAFSKVGMGRPAESWSAGEAVDGTRPDEGDDPMGAGDPPGAGDPAGSGDPERDPYVVDGGAGDDEAPGEGPSDSGPLLRPGKEAAA